MYCYISQSFHLKVILFFNGSVKADTARQQEEKYCPFFLNACCARLIFYTADLILRCFRRFLSYRAILLKIIQECARE